MRSLREEVTAIIAAAGKDDEVVVRLESAGGAVPHYGFAAAQLMRLRDKAIKVTVTVRGQTKTVDQRGRSTILQSARWGGLPAPSSCEAGHCATCMARVVEGRVEMATNDALSVEEVSEGWVLTCQAVPVSPVVRVVYE